MSAKSTIEWTESSWNPVRGCDKVSPGCQKCYAETFSERWRGIEGHPFQQGFDLRLVSEKLHEPIKWKKGRKIFVNSMSDLFHPGVPVEYIERVFDVMIQAPQHTYQILTKRHERMRDMMKGPLNRFAEYPHIWLGVSAENERYGLPRIVELTETPAAVRFVSCEPLLGEINLFACPRIREINWVIVGGESGDGCRPMDIEWARSLKDQCMEAGIAYFLKQLGGFPDKRHSMADFPKDLRIREFPKTIQ